MQNIRRFAPSGEMSSDKFPKNRVIRYDAEQMKKLYKPSSIPQGFPVGVKEIVSEESLSPESSKELPQGVFSNFSKKKSSAPYRPPASRMRTTESWRGGQNRVAQREEERGSRFKTWNRDSREREKSSWDTDGDATMPSLSEQTRKFDEERKTRGRRFMDRAEESESKASRVAINLHDLGLDAVENDEIKAKDNTVEDIDTTLSELMRNPPSPTADELVEHFQAPITTPQHYFYIDPHQNIQGPFSVRDLREWLLSGSFRGHPLPLATDRNGPFVPIGILWADVKNAFLDAPTMPDFSIWFYQDRHGVIQGPFPVEQMKQWYSGGHLSPMLLCRPGVVESVPFLQVQQFFPNPHFSFDFVAVPQQMVSSAQLQIQLQQMMESMNAETESLLSFEENQKPILKKLSELIRDPVHKEQALAKGMEIDMEHKKRRALITEHQEEIQKLQQVYTETLAEEQRLAEVQRQKVEEEQKQAELLRQRVEEEQKQAELLRQRVEEEQKHQLELQLQRAEIQRISEQKHQMELQLQRLEQQKLQFKLEEEKRLQAEKLRREEEEREEQKLLERQEKLRLQKEQKEKREAQKRELQRERESFAAIRAAAVAPVQRVVMADEEPRKEVEVSPKMVQTVEQPVWRKPIPLVAEEKKNPWKEASTNNKPLSLTEIQSQEIRTQQQQMKKHKVTKSIVKPEIVDTFVRKSPSSKTSLAAIQREEEQRKKTVQLQAKSIVPSRVTQPTPTAWGLRPTPKSVKLTDIQAEEVKTTPKVPENGITLASLIGNNVPKKSWGPSSVATPKSLVEIQKMEQRTPKVIQAAKIAAKPRASSWMQPSSTKVPVAKTQPSKLRTSSPVVRSSEMFWEDAPSSTKKEETNEFGGKEMGKDMLKWVANALIKIGHSYEKQKTLMNFCMTVDAATIREQFSLYLGSKPSVRNFATEFIRRKAMETESVAPKKRSRR
eukprot:TRINITY_DN1439_c0_g1_i1.p1 TRINITY_DN1439_c0_g1~~TRINITY_DN1439_c0_g1_i1.p1  ORF type:complete len:950 (+),score=308.12 TRINITY_DN1439_c0_g1_i1:34-2883(+)